ncbi:MAG: hypothetical protein GY796_28715 [Chloroflexi bacterium]|nr:hypothetical protein [Chloroflexota bacterium]
MGKRFQWLIGGVLLPLLVLVWGGRLLSLRANTAVILISEYVEGSSNNKAIEIYNGTGAAVDLTASGYQLEFYFNGNSSPLNTIALTGVVADGDVYVVADDSASAPQILAQADLLATGTFFNGNDAIVLRDAVGIVDVIGQVGFDPVTEWGSGDISTQNNTLRRLSSICTGDTNPSDVFDPALEWSGWPQDTFDGLGSHTAVCTPPTDTAPDVLGTKPISVSTAVPLTATIHITFTEAVTLTPGWFDLYCGTSMTHTVVVSGGPASYQLMPDTAFTYSELCTVTLLADHVFDVDTDDPPDNMAADFVFTFTTVSSSPPTCHDTATCLSVSKSVSPEVDVPYHGLVTYTINVTNESGLILSGLLLTDVLPSVVDFDNWLTHPGGADVQANVLTWQGRLTTAAKLSLMFTAVHTGAYGDIVSNQVNVQSGGNIFQDAAQFNVETPLITDSWKIYLPVTLAALEIKPGVDLVVTAVQVNNPGAEVTIGNAGTEPITVPFRVDLYVDPVPVPTQSGELWSDLAANGLAWLVTAPLQPGELLTLVYSTAVQAPNLYYLPDESIFPSFIFNGTPVYAQVDTTGVVKEWDEVNGREYNNVSDRYIVGE